MNNHNQYVKKEIARLEADLSITLKLGAAPRNCERADVAELVRSLYFLRDQHEEALKAGAMIREFYDFERLVCDCGIFQQHEFRVEWLLFWNPVNGGPDDALVSIYEEQLGNKRWITGKVHDSVVGYLLENQRRPLQN